MFLALKRYSRPTSVADGLRLFAEPNQQVAWLAGGTDLNARDHEHLTHVIDLQALGLDGVRRESAWLCIGPMVTLGRLRREPACEHPRLGALQQAAAAYANVGLQNRSTVGGRVMVGRADQDVPPALVALGARLRVSRIVDGEVREEELPYPLGSVARAALCGGLLTEIRIPLGEGRSALRRMGRSAVDVPLATCAAASGPGGVALAANQRGPSVASLGRLGATEALASGWRDRRPADWRKQARVALLAELGAHQDPWASARYRRDLTATLAIRALAAVLGEPEVP